MIGERLTIAQLGRPRVDIDLDQDGLYVIKVPGLRDDHAASLSIAAEAGLRLHQVGYEVYFHGSPLIPASGVFGWLHRSLDWLESRLNFKRINQWQKTKNP